MEIKNVKSVGQTLFNIRTKLGKTQEQVAENVGISYVSLSRYETGQRMPKMDILARLAAYYGVSVDEILKNDEKKDSAPEDGAESQPDLYRIYKSLTPEDRAKFVSYGEFLIASHTTD